MTPASFHDALVKSNPADLPMPQAYVKLRGVGRR